MNKWDFYTTKEIKPEGWLFRQLEIQAKGLSGNLHKIWPDVRDSAWIGGEREGWERVPYWLDGFIPLAYLLEDCELISVAKKYIDSIISKQREDGWICPLKEGQSESEYDSWAVQLIAKTLTVYYQCSGDERIPEVIYKALRNYYDLLKSGKIKLFHWGKFRWFETFIALNFLYKRQPEEWMKELAAILKKQGYDYSNAVESWKSPKRLWQFKTHIVNLTMMLKYEAVSCDLIGGEYTDEAEKLREILDRYNGTVFEGFTGDECLSGISPVQGTELCSVVEQMYSYELLYAYTGDSKWAERLEVLAFNALPATISEDMWTHQYDQMSNQIACEKFFMKTPFGTNGPSAHLFGLEPNYGCCTANFNQGFPKLALSAFMHKGDIIINSIMLPCRLNADGVEIELETDYPFENKMRYSINAQREFDFVIRIPSFAQNVKLDGKTAEAKDIELHINKGETEICLEFDTPVYLKERPNSLFAAKKGSLLFSVPIAYKKRKHEYTRKGVERKFPYCDYELIPQGKWNYGFSNDMLSATFNGVGDVPFSQSNPPVTVTANMKRIHWGHRFMFPTMCAKTPKSTKPISKETKIELIPYGCAKLRMTEMPICEK
ncbi:MAG: glycoside hydrolase family 127 protein [Clostridiaceae bacterium]|nr:glycoside hydrolase family 127 protein [Clostridiaceae bacterium]